MSNSKRLTVVITGASKGIGQATAERLAKKNINLVLGSRSQEESKSESISTFPLDVSDEDSVKSFCQHAVESFGQVDVLIHSAGVGVFESILDSSTRDFDEMIATNLRGTYLVCKYFGKHMVENGHGHILNLISMAGKTALPGCGGYSASKFGALGLTKVLQAELRTKGVQITAVLPGAVKSSFWDTIDPKPDLSDMIPAETVAEYLIQLIEQPPGAYVDEIMLMPPLGIL